LRCRPSYPGDIKLQWGALEYGGAAKAKEQLWQICLCRLSSLHVPQDKSNASYAATNRREAVLIMMTRSFLSSGVLHYDFLCPDLRRNKLVEELVVNATQTVAARTAQMISFKGEMERRKRTVSSSSAATGKVPGATCGPGRAKRSEHVSRSLSRNNPACYQYC
jgi:hypothetical protein